MTYYSFNILPVLIKCPFVFCNHNFPLVSNITLNVLSYFFIWSSSYVRIPLVSAIFSSNKILQELVGSQKSRQNKLCLISALCFIYWPNIFKKSLAIIIEIKYSARSQIQTIATVFIIK